VAERAELDDVAAEEEGDRPVGDDTDLPREEWELVEVIRPGAEPAEEPSNRDGASATIPL
jgi:hypothetical protein